MRILACSSSKAGNSEYLEPVVPLVKDFLGSTKLRIAFIPFASVGDPDDYLAKVREGFKSLPYYIELATPENAHEVIINADAIMTGGGNTFKLLHDLYKLKLMELIKKKIMSGTPYIGWSAGANITGLTIGTTNDMPVIEPESFKALAFLPFQINPHYTNAKPQGHNGETRDQRLEEFVIMNPAIKVIGLHEGTALRKEGDMITYIGTEPAVLFRMDGGVVRKVADHGPWTIADHRP